MEPQYEIILTIYIRGGKGGWGSGSSCSSTFSLFNLKKTKKKSIGTKRILIFM